MNRKFGLFAEKLSVATGRPIVVDAPPPEPEYALPEVWPYHGGHCFYCGRKLTEPPSGGMPKQWSKRHTMRTRDHVVPRSKQADEFSITVHACHACNQAKKDLSLEEFRSWCAMMLNRPVDEMIFFGEKL